MKRHCENAQIIAEYLEGNPKVTKVLYPGLDSFPQASIARRQHSRGHGGLLAFELKGGVKSGLKFASNLSLITLAENLGAVESMVTHPATMTHAAMSKQARLEAGITDGLIRLSVGLEDVDDLILRSRSCNQEAEKARHWASSADRLQDIAAGFLQKILPSGSVGKDQSREVTIPRTRTPTPLSIHV